MNPAEQFEQFLTWIRAFDVHFLIGRTEAEVKTHFVVPFFLHLGYPRGGWREEYSITTYEPGKGRSRPKVDLIYFSTLDVGTQTADTSLIIVEAKNPTEADLGGALEQARFYGYHLASLFFVATNGHRIVIVKRLGFRSEECLFDLAVGELQNEVIAGRIYRELHFEVVCRLKALFADPGTHQLYTDLIRTLDRHPDLPAQLSRGDFHPSRTRDGQCLTVIESTVSVVCTVPRVFGAGDGRIEFSSLLLRGLACHLTQQQILSDCLCGLGTPIDWGTRPFLQRTESGLFRAHLGQTTVMLSAQEARDLCTCLDVVGWEYKAALEGTEAILETWDYRPAILRSPREYGFHIHTVAAELWELMLRFARTFAITEGRSDWHIFTISTQLYVIPRSMKRALCIYPIHNREAHTVDLMYCVGEDREIAREEQRFGYSWKREVGPQGWWTARYAEDWLAHTFIPHVLDYYEPEQGWDPFQDWSWGIHEPSRKRISLDQAQTPKDLAFSVQRVHSWLQAYHSMRIAASLLHAYYKAMADLLQCIQTIAEDQVEYCLRQMAAVKIAVAEDLEQTECASQPVVRGAHPREGQLQLLLDAFQMHAVRILIADTENADAAEYLSGAFLALLENGVFHYGQGHINAVKDAVRPLLDLGRFEERYVLVPWKEIGF